MENGSRRLLTFLLLSFLLGWTLYANRKKLKALFQRRVRRLNQSQKDFVQAVGEHL